MNAIIIDDDPVAIDSLRKKLASYPEISIIATATNGVEGLEAIIQQLSLIHI